MAQSMSIFKKEDKKKETAYYWASVSGQDKDGDPINATIFVRMSKKAAALFDRVAETTRNKAITRVYAEINTDDAWLKAVPGNEHNTVVLFINSFDVKED